MVSLNKLVLVGFCATAVAGFGGSSAAKPKGKKVVVKKKAPVKKAPVKKAPVRKAVVSKGGFSPGSDIGVTPPLGLFDPLGFLSRGPDAYRRYQEIEIKHGRLAMAATLGVITTEAGVRLPGYLSYSQDLPYADVPGTLDGAYFSVPLAGWAQIVALIAALDIAVFRQARTHRLPPLGQPFRRSHISSHTSSPAAHTSGCWDALSTHGCGGGPWATVHAHSWR